MSHPSTPVPGSDSTDRGELQRRFGSRWQIQLEDLGVWSALRRSEDGHHIRVIIAHSPAELLAKLDTAETVEP